MGWEDGEDDGSDGPMVSAEPDKDDEIAGVVNVKVGRNEVVRLVSERMFASFGYDEQSNIKIEVKKAVSALVKKAMEERVKEISEQAVRDVVADMIANGWDKTDSYGQPSGKVTVKQLMIGHLTNNGDGYSNRESLIARTTKEMFDRLLKQEIMPHVEAAQKQLKMLLEKTVADSLKKALLEGAGLKA